MCVPVRSRFSRSNSTSSSRGSTWSLCSLPLTFTRIATICSCSGINVTELYFFTTRPLQRDFQAALDQRRHQLPLVLGRAPHIGLRIGGRARRLGSCLHRLSCHLVIAQSRFRL